MKHMILGLILLAASSSQALESVDANGAVFGVASGTYTASGILKSQSAMVPDLQYVSVRRIHDGIIEAKTTATMKGRALATASATLKVVPSVDRRLFTFVDLETNQVAGRGFCEAGVCTFKVTVMDGSLTLNETWQATPDGFLLKNGSQVFHGATGTYQTQFTRVK